VAIDMPIGLSSDGRRSCEQAARRFISPRGSTVFPTPIRACLDAVDYAQACAISRRTIGKAISKQAWHILPKIREVDSALARLRANGARGTLDRVVESHPECSFAAMNGGGVLRDSKHTASGLAARTALIEREFGMTIPARLPGARRDDILDAYAMLWTAERVAGDGHIALHGPGGPETDDAGITMQIVV
jgi:predicted RNase H-like nuclease